MEIRKGSTIYFVGIAGTGMAAVAGLLQEAGFKVVGSDAGIYPPMSTMLNELNIKVYSPYDAKNIDDARPDICVIANALSRGNVELEHVLSKGLLYTSFPAICGEQFIKDRIGVVVTGTHGKTTTTSLLAHTLHALGEDPSFVIGGIPRNFTRSFRLGSGKTFAIEGDEYDTAYFDKGPKFLHYHPHHLIVNNIEFDHADIYKNVEAIEDQFVKLCTLVPKEGRIFVNSDDPGVQNLLKRTGTDSRFVRVATLGKDPAGAVKVLSYGVKSAEPELQIWSLKLKTATMGTIDLDTTLTGKHNIANVAQVVACMESLGQLGHLEKRLSVERLQEALTSFKPPKRRLDHLGSYNGIDVYEDFAHHPTAVELVIEGFKASFPKKRLVVAFEPRNATSRRNTFQNDYIKKLAGADRILIGHCPVDQRIPEAERMNTEAIAQGIGSKATAFATNEELLETVSRELNSGDAVIFMSSGSFSGVQYQLAERLKGIRA
jgi:UDP-N-acetylmuramate: L-alanyl-gamma-D-glutamyl-meso-diaminopimelate ligase